MAGKADPPPRSKMQYYLHPDSPFTDKQLDGKRLTVSFEKVKLTNNESDKTGQVNVVYLKKMIKFVRGRLSVRADRQL